MARVAFIGSIDSPPRTQAVFRGFVKKCVDWAEEYFPIAEYVFTGRPGWDFATVCVYREMKRRGHPCKLIAHMANFDLGPFLADIATLPGWMPEPDEIANPGGLYGTPADSFEAAMHSLTTGTVAFTCMPPHCREWGPALSSVANVYEIVHSFWMVDRAAVGKKRPSPEIY